jgi:nitrogen fixation protein NifQ
MAHAAGAGNDLAFASMIASQVAGAGALPPWLGLQAGAFRRLLAYHFPGVRFPVVADPPGPERPGGQPRCRLVSDQVPDPREDERGELERLLLMHRAGESPSEVWMAQVVAAGCMSSDHLWQDLGLMDRRELTALMRRNFPALAGRNVRDMKWKRFLYKQLCEAEGIYTCRAPSCEVCTDYHVCFGPDG